MQFFWVLDQKKRRRMLFGAIILLAALLFIPQPTEPAISTASSPRRLPVYGVNTEEAVVSLTFDCAWENSDTDELLSLLEEYNVPATFFATGDWCRRFPEDVRRIFAAGHAVENHSDTHPHPTAVSAGELIRDTAAANDTITELTETPPRYYRAPYGEYSDTVMAAIEDECGLQVIQWDVDSRDWQGRTASEMAESVIGSVRCGSILLFHNDTANTPAALRQILPALQAKGYRFVRLDEMVLPTGTPVDNEGRQIPPGDPASDTDSR